MGARVEFRGIKIGRVAAISYSLLDDATIDEMPVLVQLDTRLLEKNFPSSLIRDESGGFTQEISESMRATLKSSNLLTGQLFVELDYYPAEDGISSTLRGGYTVLPTEESGLGRLEDKLAALLDKINGLGVEDMIADVSETSKQATATLASLENTIEADDGVVGEAEETLAEMKATLASLNKILDSGETKAIPGDLRETLANLNATLKPLSNDGALYGDVRRTLDELRGATRSIDRLVGELADKPNSLIFGKDENTKKIPRAR